MKLLIDTQVFVWLTEGDSRMGARAMGNLSDLNNALYISYFSLFEMAIKASVGKMRYDNSVIEDLPLMGMELVMPDRLLLATYKIFNPSNRDPFDNVLIATAIQEKCTFVTSDPKILNVSEPGLSLIDAQI